MSQSTKSLSQLLAQIDPDADRMALRQDLIKLKAIAITLAEACEWMQNPEYFYMSCLPMLDKALNDARKILEDSNGKET